MTTATVLSPNRSADLAPPDQNSRSRPARQTTPMDSSSAPPWTSVSLKWRNEPRRRQKAAESRWLLVAFRRNTALKLAPQKGQVRRRTLGQPDHREIPTLVSLPISSIVC